MSCIVNPVIQNPFIDLKVIKELQSIIASGGWCQYVFGLAERSMEKKGEENIIYPAILKQDCNDYINLFPNDRMTSFCFFERRDELEFDYNEDEINYTIGIVCWADLKKLNSSLTHDFTDQIIAKVLSSLQSSQLGAGSIQLTDSVVATNISVVTDRTEVWDRYDRTFTDYAYHAYPFTTFRIDIEATDYNPVQCQSKVNTSFLDGYFTPLNWRGVTTEYLYDIDNTSASDFNRIRRDSTGSDEDNIIQSVQVFDRTKDFYVGGDTILITNALDFIVSIQDSFADGTDFSTLDSSDVNNGFRVDGTSVYLFDNGSQGVEVATFSVNNIISWRMEYLKDSDELKILIEDQVVTTYDVSSTTGDLAVTMLGIHIGDTLGDHFYAHIGSVPSIQLLNSGDSITSGRTNVVGAVADRVYHLLKLLDNNYVSTTIAVPAFTSTQVKNSQVPVYTRMYDSTKSKNVIDLMTGIVDLLFGFALSTTQSNIVSIVNSAHAAGYDVIIHTVVKEWSDPGLTETKRNSLNDWILAGNSGADYVVDHTNSPLETDSTYYLPDLIHPNAEGYEILARESMGTHFQYLSS